MLLVERDLTLIIDSYVTRFEMVAFGCTGGRPEGGDSSTREFPSWRRPGAHGCPILAPCNTPLMSIPARKTRFKHFAV